MCNCGRTDSDPFVHSRQLIEATHAVVQMTHPPSNSALGPKFNPFLFALVRKDAAQSPLSVVSVLARLDVDPWQEAAELTRMPKEAASHRLARLLSSLPGDPSGQSDCGPIATRLITLLPGHAGPEIISSGSWPRPGVLVDPRVVLILYLIAAAALATSFRVVSGQPQQVQFAPNSARAAGAAASQSSPSNARMQGLDRHQQEAP